MKKFTTLLGAIALGVATMGAAPVNPGMNTDLRISGTTEAFKNWQKNIDAGKLIGTQDVETRSWTSGTSVYDVRFQLASEPLGRMLSFQDKDGNIINPTFDELPFYAMWMTVSRRKQTDDVPNTMVSFLLAWPSQYIYQQVFTYDGEPDDKGQIPVDLRNYDVVPVDELFNNEQYCRRFQESLSAGTAGDASAGGWDYYTMVPNQLVGNVAVVDNNMVYTVVTDKIASFFEMMQYSPEDNWTQLYGTIYYSTTGEDNGTRNIRLGTKSKPFDGEASVEGFSQQYIDVPEFGDLHIFNTGVMSSASFGDANPFPTDFPEVTGLYFTISDKYVGWEVDAKGETGAIPFDKEKFVSTGATLPEGQSLREHANYVQGYLFADPKYGKDTSLDLDPTTYVMQPVTEIQVNEDVWYAETTPAINSMVAYGITDMNQNTEQWSDEYGAAFIYQNMPETCVDPSYFGWGYKEGIVVNFQNQFLTNYIAYSKGKIYYHYDPENMVVYRELQAVGEKDAVEEVAVDELGAKINAANGVITVVAGADAAVAVYSLDGVCLKNVNVAAGEDVAVEAAKGIYVVKVGDKAVKVAL